MPRLKNETFGGGDQSWLGSTHGIANARTEVLDISTFTAGTHYPNGYIPSGTPVAKVGGVLVPYDGTEATVTGAGILAGFVLTDQPVVGTADFAVPVLDHGRVRASKVPGTFTAPAAAAKRAATTFVFV
ncbi:head decoration protein [Isoptericola sp. NPDC056605]|uniref:head decoration protein n=1 Tax=Isoptericola sp. NPDC056605 TaxID=3345876 RepID=UPI0036A14BF1